MDRTAFTITSRGQLETAFRNAAKLAFPFVLELRPVKRTDDQNALMWCLLEAFERQAELAGKRLSKEQWKCVFLQALGREMEVLPTLDGKSWFPSGFRSSRLTKAEFSQLIELIQAEAAMRGVEWESQHG